MRYETINHVEVIREFDLMAQSRCSRRLLRIIGDAKLGKTHLVAKVFPKISSSHKHPHAIVDLRSRHQDVLDIIDAAISQLRDKVDFVQCDSLREESLVPDVQAVEVRSLKAMFAQVIINASKRPQSRGDLASRMTSSFVEDLKESNRTVFLLFDTLDEATERVLDWLANRLLVLVASLTNVRVVIAGRFLPETAGNCHAISKTCELSPISDNESYVMYCKQLGVALKESQIHVLARAVDYKPGLFADLVMTKFYNIGF